MKVRARLDEFGYILDSVRDLIPTTANVMAAYWLARADVQLVLHYRDTLRVYRASLKYTRVMPLSERWTDESRQRAIRTDEEAIARYEKKLAAARSRVERALAAGTLVRVDVPWLKAKKVATPASSPTE